MLEVEHSFELRNIYSLRFTESEICLPLFEYETQTEHKKTVSDLFIVTTSEFTNPCSKFLYSLGPRTLEEIAHKLVGATATSERDQ